MNAARRRRIPGARVAGLAAASVAVLTATVTPRVSAAQSHCKPAASTSEAKLLAFFAVPLAFSAAPDVAALSRWQVAVVGELAAIPRAPSAINVSSGACGFTKPENSALAPVLPRPRVAAGLGQGVVVELSWLPPVTVADATPHLGGVALSWTPSRVRLPLDAALTLRAHATLGGVDGPVTCPRSALQVSNSQQDCFGRVPSNDTYDPNVRGVEALAVRNGGAMHGYVGVGVNAVAARFRVNFTDDRGFLDRNTVEVSLTRVAVLGGVSWAVREVLALSLQVYSVPDDATTGRLGIAWRLR